MAVSRLEEVEFGADESGLAARFQCDFRIHSGKV